MKEIFIRKKNYIILIILLILGIGGITCFKIINISGISMEPTLSNCEKVIMRKKIFNEKCSRYDIVFIKDPYNSNEMVVKRIIGLPGERIYCENGKIYINDEVLQDDLKIDNKTENFGPIKLENSQYYVLGDNREHSTDSRVFGVIFENAIMGFYIG